MPDETAGESEGLMFPPATTTTSAGAAQAATRLRNLRISRVAFVPRGDNPNAEILIWKEDPLYTLHKAYSTAERVALAKRGAAIPVKNDQGEIVDGRYPISNAADLNNAVRALGRVAAGDREMVIRHIKKRARALGLTDQLNPDIYKGDNVDDIEKAPRLTEQRQSRLRDAMRAIGSVLGVRDEEGEPEGGTMPEGTEKQYQLPDDSPEELRKYVETLMKERDEAKAELEKRNPDPPPQPAPVPPPAEVDPVAKTLADPETPEHVRQALQKAQDAENRAAEADERVAKMEEERATEAIDRRVRDLKHLGLDVEKFVGTIRAVEKANPDAAAEIERVLRAADAQMTEFGEIGTSSGDESGALAKLNALRDDIAKREGIRPETAFTKALDTEEGKRLHAEYEKEVSDR